MVGRYLRCEGKASILIYGPNQHSFPTAFNGELLAVVQLLQHATPPLIIYIDNQTVIDGWRSGREWCTNGERATADLWREIWRLLGFALQPLATLYSFIANVT